MVNYKSKRAVVSKAPYELYMAFVDMRNFMQFLPEDKKADVTADYDSIHAVVITPDAVEGKAEPSVIRNPNAKLH